MRNQTCCFTGHRIIPEQDREKIAFSLDAEVRRLILSGYRYFGAGGALGFDTMAAQTVLSLRSEYPQVKLILVLPCKTQAERWNRGDQEIYEEIKQEANKIVYVSEKYTKDCMFRRNRHLVDCSSVCVCYMTKTTGGTAYTVNYATEQDLSIINLARR